MHSKWGRTLRKKVQRLRIKYSTISYFSYWLRYTLLFKSNGTNLVFCCIFPQFKEGVARIHKKYSCSKGILIIPIWRYIHEVWSKHFSYLLRSNNYFFTLKHCINAAKNLFRTIYSDQNCELVFWNMEGPKKSKNRIHSVDCYLALRFGSLFGLLFSMSSLLKNTNLVKVRNRTIFKFVICISI